MKYKYYGTAAAEGIPAIFCECEICKRAREKGGKDIRTRSQSVVDDKLLIDLPADTYLHTFQGLDITSIRHCLITHSHQDHLYAEELGMRRKGFAHFENENVLTMYAGVDGCNKIRASIANPAETRTQVQLMRAFECFEIEEYKITPLSANHDFYTDPFIFLIEKDGKCILHSNDTGYYPEKTFAYLKEHPVHIDLASFDCTEPMLQPENDEIAVHMNFATVCHVKEKMVEFGCIDESTICVVNHFSHNGKMLHEDIERMASEKGFLVSYDGMEIEI